MKIVVAIPCYNEEDTISKVIDSIPRSMLGIEVIEVLVIDDGSRDRTYEISKSCGANVIRHSVNKGLGVAFRSAVDWTLQNRMDILVTIDGDGQFNSEDIPKLVEKIVKGSADFVTASRFLDSDCLPDGIPPMKLHGNRMMSWLISSLVGGRYHDVSCGFRAYSKKALLNLNLFGSFTYTQEVFLDLSFKKFSIVEVSSKVTYFEGRKSRVASSLIKYAIRTLKIISRAYLSYYPLKLFWGIAHLLIISSLVFSLIFMNHYLSEGKFSGGLWAGFSGAYLFLMSVFLYILGLVVDMLDRMRVNQERILAISKQQLYYK